MCIIEELEKIKPRVEYQGYYYKKTHVIKIMILGLLCRMQTMKDKQYWATAKRISEMLRDRFGIKKIPCYSHFTNIVGLIDSEELNKIYGIFP